MTTAIPAASVLSASGVSVYLGDALTVLGSFNTNSVDAIVTDPPYAIRAVPDPGGAYRARTGRSVSGACVVCRAGRLMTGYEACAGCLNEMRVAAFADAPMLGQQSANWHDKATHSRGYADNDNTAFGLWVSLWATECFRLLKPGGHLVAFGGTRTWHRVACAVEDAGFEIRDSLAWLYSTGVPKSLDVGREVARKYGLPKRASASQMTSHGADAAKQDASNVETTTDDSSWNGWFTGVKPAHEPIVLARKPVAGTIAENVMTHGTGALNVAGTRLTDGRWPTNVYVDDDQARLLPLALDGRDSRAFFVAKPDSSERVTVNGTVHPTVKPLALMRELVRLVTPPSGLVLDPFAGSGTTAEACVLEDRRCVAIERDPDYLPLIEARLARRAAFAFDPCSRRDDRPGNEDTLF